MSNATGTKVANGVQPNRPLASWLIANRKHIEAALADQLGPAAPSAGAQETEALRRFRSFASASLVRGEMPSPALEGLKPNERRVMALLQAWVTASCQTPGPHQDEIRDAMAPLTERFRMALRTTSTTRRSRGAPRASRRAVVAAIDRIADCFLAIDIDSGRIEDANPAAGSLLGVNRDALLGVDAMRFVPESERKRWWVHLDALAESDATRSFDAALQDAGGERVAVDASVTRFSTRSRTLALVMARPSTGRAPTSQVEAPEPEPTPYRRPRSSFWPLRT